jgi:hypothetical protein
LLNTGLILMKVTTKGNIIKVTQDKLLLIIEVVPKAGLTVFHKGPSKS